MASAASAFGASALSLLLLGLGVPFIAADLLAAGGAGLLIYCLGRWALSRGAPPPGEG